MSDLCMQCALEIWGCDSGDLAGLPAGEHMTLCEGCGWCEVDGDGRCLSHPHDEMCEYMWGRRETPPDGIVLAEDDEP